MALFTCFGIGVVSRMLGAPVTRDVPEATGPTRLTLTDAGAADPFTSDLPREFTTFTAHKEGTAELPSGATLLLTNEACPVQSYRVGTRLYTTQFHPEATPEAFAERMRVYRDGGYFDADDYDRLAGIVLSAPVTEPARMLRAFTALATS